MKTGKLFLKIIAILLISISLFYAFIFCTKNEESGVKIGQAITLHQNMISNKILRNHIKQTLNHKEKGLVKLLDGPSDGEGGYAQGYLITQIIYKMGEKDFLRMVKKLDEEQKNEIYNYLEVGLMYGYDDKEMENEFPILYKYYKDLMKKS